MLENQFVEPKKNQSPIQISDLKVIWRIISRNWYIPLLIVPIFYFIGYFHAYKLENIYQASVELLKSNDTYHKESIITENEGFYNAGGSYIDNSNEIRIITSYDLMKETIEKLKKQLQVSYFLVGRVRTTEQFSGTPYSITVKNINQNLIENPIHFKILNFNEFELKYEINGIETKKIGKFNEDFIDLNFSILVSKGSGFDQSTVNQLSKLDYQIIIHDIDNLVYQYKNALNVVNPDYTNVLVLTLDDILPERAILILDTLSKLYIKKSLNSRFEINERTISFIDKQLDDVSLSLKEIEDTMQHYKKQKHILDLDWESQDYFKKLSDFDSRKSQLKLKIDAINDLEKYIIEDKDPQFLPPNVYLVDDDEFLKSSVAELYNTQIELNILLSHSKEINPNIIAIRQKLKGLKQNMLVYLNNSRNASYKITENVNSEIGNYVSEIKEIPKKQRDVLNISRKVAVNEELYNFLLQKRANTKIARASIVPNIKVIDSPRNQGVISPNKNKIISLYLTIGLAISLIITIIKIIFFSTIQSIEELKEITELPIIGDLPFQRNISSTGFFVNENPSSPISEAFRTLRTNLQYAILNSNKRTILLTSHGPGEGKTFTTINIGTVLAKGGKRVVMLELDLHKPRIQKALEMNADIGISTFMEGQNTLDEIVKPTIIKNLYTVLSGPIPPNPSELVLSEKLKEIIDYAKNNFDFVLIDTPPAGLLSDATYLMQFADLNLIILNTKFVNKSIVKFFEKTIKNNSIKDVYFVLNGVKHKRSKYYYYARYGYGYGYGYGYNSNQKNS